MKFLKRRADEADFQLAPMIDIVFQLLIFFMCASSFFPPESHLNVNLPTIATAKQVTELPEEVVIDILADGAIMVNEKVYDSPESKDLPELKAMLMTLAMTFEGQAVIIYGDWDVSHERVTDVLNACAGAKIKSVSFLIPEEVISRLNMSVKK